MNVNDKLSIRVNVADRYYPLKIDRHDEEKIRKAAKMINDKVIQYKQRYEDKDVQDFLAMAALQFVTKVVEEDTKQDISPIIDILRDIDNELAEYIQKA